MLLLAHQLGVFFLLGFAPSLSGRATFAHLACLGLLELFGVLTVDLGDDFLDARVWI
jgi:hypothetical protein|tara:strand:- start:137 stop:307 length:171 start_codon:yes stop_codon:yes gene_type:complete